MSKRARKKARREEQKQEVPFGPWISMRSGIMIISLLSIAMGILTAVQVWSSRPPLQAIAWGLIFGGLIWVIFLGYLYFNRWIRGGTGQEKK